MLSGGFLLVSTERDIRGGLDWVGVVVLAGKKHSGWGLAPC